MTTPASPYVPQARRIIPTRRATGLDIATGKRNPIIGTRWTDGHSQFEVVNPGSAGVKVQFDNGNLYVLDYTYFAYCQEVDQ